MEVFREPDSLQKFLSAHRCAGRSIGLVPTMGALHDGHLSLLSNALRENDIVVSTIYVNPTQFNNAEDLEKYPRQEQHDLQMLEESGCHAVFVPPDEVMYPERPRVTVGFSEMEASMEGEFRPGHFNGVALVVAKLFNAVQPDRAYFGQKDLQQYLIIRQLVRDLGFRVTLRCIPIFREASGLAMSSRNQRLTDQERTRAAHIHRMLQESATRLREGGSWEQVQKGGLDYLSENGLRPEYFEYVDVETLAGHPNHFDGNEVALCVAAYVGTIRLIDNLILDRS